MAIHIRQELDPVAMRRQLQGPNSGMAHDLLRRGLRVQTDAKRRVDVLTGHTRNSINIANVEQVVNGFSVTGVRVGSSLELAQLIHRGTGIYGPRGAPITARSGKLLVFTDRRTGRLVFARSVRGRRPNPFLKRALSAARG